MVRRRACAVSNHGNMCRTSFEARPLPSLRRQRRLACVAAPQDEGSHAAGLATGLQLTGISVRYGRQAMSTECCE